jgi:hypothetical protein
VLHGLLKSIEMDANFSAAAVLIYCFVERKLVHFAVALNQCSRALVSVLRRDMTKNYPVVTTFVLSLWALSRTARSNVRFSMDVECKSLSA